MEENKKMSTEASIQFSNIEIKKKALEIIGTSNIDIRLKSPGKIKIVVKYANKKNLKRFKRYVNSIKPLGVTVAIYKGY
jgi:hypothetical protein